MSVTQSEREVVRDGRKKTLGEEAEASMRDKSVDSLIRTLNENDVGMKISRAWSTSTTSLSTTLERQRAILADLDDFRVTSDSPNPFGGMSNLHLPVLFTIVKSYHARFLEALLAVDPPFSVKSRRENGSDRVQTVEDLMRYALFYWANDYKGIDDVVDVWLWQCFSTGTGIMKARWDTKFERYPAVRDVYTPTTPLSQVDAMGNEVLIPQWAHEEVEDEIVEKVFDGPQYYTIDMEDIRIIGGDGDPDHADMVLERKYSTASDLWTMVDRGIYDRDVVEFLIQGGKDDPQYGGLNSSIKQQRALNAGRNPTSDDTELDRYELVEACMRYDVYGSGINSEIVVTVEKRTGKILNGTFLRRISRTGQRPYAVIHFHKRPGEPFGVGLGEILAPLTSELDTMHNIRIDNALFESTPFYVYRNTASFDPDSVVIEPGVGIGVDDMGDIMFPQLPPRTAITAAEEGAVNSYIERLTGISDLSLGVLSSTQGATRTATGARALMGENNSNLSVHLRRINKGWTKVLRTTWHMLQNRVEPGFSFRITGDDGGSIFRKVDNLDLSMEIDFEISSNSSNSNKSVQIELFQTLIGINQNPLNIQMGIVNAETLYASHKSYLGALGLKDIHRYLVRPQNYAYVPSPEEEFARVIRGEDVPVLPQADHAAFIAFVQTMIAKQDDPNMAVLNAEQFGYAVDQMKRHQQMLQALQAQQAQVANTQQIATNMQQGVAPSYSNQSGGYGRIF